VTTIYIDMATGRRWYWSAEDEKVYLDPVPLYPTPTPLEALADKIGKLVFAAEELATCAEDKNGQCVHTRNARQAIADLNIPRI